MEPMTLRELEKIEQSWKAYPTSSNVPRLFLNYIADLCVEVRNYMGKIEAANAEITRLKGELANYEQAYKDMDYHHE